MKLIRNEVQIFFTALMFFTRIPCPSWVDHDEHYLNQSTRYFPLMGWIVGGLTAITFWGAAFFFSKEVALILSFVVGVLTTGAFHEDGFADVCDAFGGGWTKEKILEIMKDSRLGTYGVVGTLLIYLLRFFLLMSIDITLIPLVIIGGATLSRFCATTFIYTHNYVRENEDSKAKPLAKQMSIQNLLIAMIFGLSGLLVFQSYYIFILLIPAYITKYFLSRYFQKWIGGYTGDCLGATQQVCEIVFYMSFIILWKFI